MSNQSQPADEKSKGIFFDEWQACLRAHYRFVIEMNDEVTEPTLRHVLLQTGLTAEELDALAAEVRAGLPPPESAPADDHEN